MLLEGYGEINAFFCIYDTNFMPFLYIVYFKKLSIEGYDLFYDVFVVELYGLFMFFLTILISQRNHISYRKGKPAVIGLYMIVWFIVFELSLKSRP